MRSKEKREIIFQFAGEGRGFGISKLFTWGYITRKDCQKLQQLERQMGSGDRVDDNILELLTGIVYKIIKKNDNKG